VSIIDNVGDALGTALEKAKDVPVETVCAVGLTLIAGAAILAKAGANGAEKVIDAVTDVTSK
jgi:hypothetical protein